jgi:DNA segregation ATPase FtsK/SpoIIIE-like protein
MNAQLESQADKIEAVLALNKVPARVTGGAVTPRWIRFQVFPAAEAALSSIGNVDGVLSAAIGTPGCRMLHRGAVATVEVPRDDPYPVRLLPLYEQLTKDERIPPVTAILGLEEDGTPLLVRLPAPDVGHVLVAGMAGAGKTTLLRTMVLSLAWNNGPDDLAFVIMGDALPGIEQAIGDGHRVGRMTCAADASSVSGCLDAGRVVFIADDMVSDGGVAFALSFLMEKERRHFLAAWDGVPPSQVTELFRVRLVGRVASVTDARDATGWRGTGAEQLLGRGDFLAVAEGRVSRFQAAYVEDS